jgi:hypothetical protein
MSALFAVSFVCKRAMSYFHHKLFEGSQRPRRPCFDILSSNAVADNELKEDKDDGQRHSLASFAWRAFASQSYYNNTI